MTIDDHHGRGRWWPAAGRLLFAARWWWWWCVTCVSRISWRCYEPYSLYYLSPRYPQWKIFCRTVRHHHPPARPYPLTDNHPYQQWCEMQTKSMNICNDDIQFPSLISGEDLENWREDWNWRPIKLHLEWIRQPDATQQPASNGQTPETGGCDANHTIKAQQSKPETLSLSLHRRRRRGIHSHLLRFGYSIVGISASCTPNPILSSRTIEREVVVGLRSPARRE